MSYKIFTDGELLTATDLNNNLMRQTVISCANVAARDAIASPQEGMVVYLVDTNVYQGYTGTAWYQVAHFGAGAMVTQAASAGTATTNSTVTFAAITSGPGIVFVAPSSGKVIIHITAYMMGGSAGGTECMMGFEVREGGTVGSGTVFQAAGTLISNGTSEWIKAGGTQLVSVLTAGSTYNVRPMFRSEVAATTVTASVTYLIVQPLA